MKTVRDGQKVWPYCSECGCRLSISHAGIYTENRLMIGHFGDEDDRDARGCYCSRLLNIVFVPRDKFEAFYSRTLTSIFLTKGLI